MSPNGELSHDQPRTPRPQVGGVLADVWEASSRLRSTEVVKANRYELRSFEGYVHHKELTSNSEKASMVQLPTSYNDMMQTVGMREKGAQGSVLRAKLWLARRQFQLQLEHLLLLLQAAATCRYLPLPTVTCRYEFLLQAATAMCIRVARVFFTRNACSLRSSRARRRRFQVVSVANDRVQRLVDAI